MDVAGIHAVSDLNDEACQVQVLCPIESTDYHEDIVCPPFLLRVF